MGRTVYFGYGRNTDVDEMRRRCARSELLGVGRLDGWRFSITTRGYATVVEEPDGEVHGLVWALTDADLAALDDKEGVAVGTYHRVRTEVSLEASTVVAEVYLASDDTPGDPWDDYIEIISDAARRHEFPAHYRRELAAWQRRARHRDT